MITTLDIVKAVAIQIKGKFDAKVCIDKEQLQKYTSSNNCIYIEVTTLASEVATLFANTDSIVIDIAYYPVGAVDRSELYEIESKIRCLFIRSLKIGRDYMHINSLTPDIVKDEVGWRLNVSLIGKLYNNMLETTFVDGKKISGTDKIEILDPVQVMTAVDLEVKDGE